MYCYVPMQPIPNHQFSCSVPIDNLNLLLRFRMMYNELAGYWVVDISKGDTPVLSGLPVIPAQDILEQFKYLGIGSAYIVPKSEVQEQWPSANTLSSDWYVLWGDTDG